MNISEKLEILQNCLNLVNGEIAAIPESDVERDQPVIVEMRRKQFDRYRRITTGVSSLMKEMALQAAMGSHVEILK